MPEYNLNINEISRDLFFTLFRLSSYLGKKYRRCDIENVEKVITEKPISEEDLKCFKDKGISLERIEN